MEAPPTRHDKMPRPDSPEPEPSCVSIRSMNPPMKFEGNLPSDTQSDYPGPELSCVSLQSMNPPMKFEGNLPSDTQSDYPGPEPSCVSIRSMSPPMKFQDDPPSDAQSEVPMDQSPDLESIFKVLQEGIFTFEKNELKKFQMILSSEEIQEDEVDDETWSIRAAFLKITLHFLKTMKLENMADCLQNRAPANICQHQLKSHLRKKSQFVFEGIPQVGNQIYLNQIFTELYITHRVWGEVSDQHEIKQIEMASWKPERTIRCEEIFTASVGRDGSTRTVMTVGMAGIGKTVLTQKFILDWAEDKANQDMVFMFPFAFKELNLLKEKKFSLVELVHFFFREIKESGICRFEEFQVLFIFDGLDECRLPLDFNSTEILTDVTESTSMEVLLINLIRGKLLPSARLWITTRPAAANQIPPDCVDIITEVRGFKDLQKEEYFRKRFRDDEKANRVISHVQASQSLHVMCHIPVFCWITATVLEDMLTTTNRGELPKTLTEMYIQFLVVQSRRRSIKYDGGTQMDQKWNKQTRKTIKSLGKLAFEQLQKGNLIFYESDLRECGLDIKAASMYSGVFTQIFKEETGLFEDKLFSFVHLSVQEFLAALYVQETFSNSGVNLLSTSFWPKHLRKQTFKHLYRSAVDKASQNLNGHLDVFLRFLLGLSLPKNQTLLRGLLSQTPKSDQISQETVQYIKKKLDESQSPERSINLFHCLNELNDHTLVVEIQQYLSSGHLSTKKLSPVMWSALVFTLLSSGKDLDEFDLKKYSGSEDVLLRLLPVVKASHKAWLSSCNLSEKSCDALSTVLSSHTSSLRDLDLSQNNLQDTGVSLLSPGLMSSNSALETLKLNQTKLSKASCKVLSSVLSSQSSTLRSLDLSQNKLQDSGIVSLSAGLRSSHCALETLRIRSCGLSERSCEALSSVLSSQSSSLRDLDISQNKLQDSGAMLLSTGLLSPHCALQALRLSHTEVSEKCCKDLSSVLGSKSSALRILDLSQNDLQDSGVAMLSTGIKSPHCELEKLSLSGCMVSEEGCVSLVDALTSNPAHLGELDLSYNHPGDTGKSQLLAGVKNPHWKLETLRLEHCGEQRLTPALKKYACDLTVDTNTVHRKLKLSNNSRTIKLVTVNQPYPNHLDRFDKWPQLLCGNILSARYYWEVEWEKRVNIAVAYRGINRQGEDNASWLGRNSHSWSLICSEVDGFAVWHDRKRQECPKPPSSSMSQRVAVYVDCPAGILSFYCVAPDAALIHLHTFDVTFTEPVYPGFGFAPDWPGSSVILCPI